MHEEADQTRVGEWNDGVPLHVLPETLWHKHFQASSKTRFIFFFFPFVHLWLLRFCFPLRLPSQKPRFQNNTSLAHRVFLSTSLLSLRLIFSRRIATIYAFVSLYQIWCFCWDTSEQQVIKSATHLKWHYFFFLVYCGCLWHLITGPVINISQACHCKWVRRNHIILRFLFLDCQFRVAGAST